MADAMLFPHHTTAPPQSDTFTHALWDRLQQQLQNTYSPASGVHGVMPDPPSAPALLARLIADRLRDQTLSFHTLYPFFLDIFQNHTALMVSAAQDLHAHATRAAGSTDFVTPFLYNKGFQAVQAYRLAHILWGNAQRFLALHLQSRISETTGIDIHPAANLGHRLILGPGSGHVIGETTLVENDVVLMADTTLGGTGKQAGKRHPTLRQGTLVGPGAQILGPIDIGEGAKIGAGAVVLKPVLPFSAVAGNPARYVNNHSSWPVLTMDLSLPSIDYLI